MARVAKTPSTTSAPVVAPTTAPAAQTAPTVPEVPKKKRVYKKRAVAPVVAADTPATPTVTPTDAPVDATPTVDAPAPVEDTRSVHERLELLTTTLKALMDNLRECRKEISNIDKQNRREQKAPKRRVKSTKTPSAPYGIVKEVPITDALRTFIVSNALVDNKGLSLPESGLCSSARATSFMHNYIDKKQLFRPENKKEFIPDAPLKTLLDLNRAVPVVFKPSKKNVAEDMVGKPVPTDVLTYPRLQSFLAHHFIRTPVEVSA